MNKLLEHKVALITGASRGIGRTTALLFAQEGCDVAFTYLHSADKAQALQAEITALGVRCECYCADATDFQRAQEVVSEVLKTFGKIDVLVNNAGVTADGLLMRMTEEQWDKVITGCLKSTFNYTHAVVPYMIHQRSGSIISLASSVGLNGNPGQCNYSAAKAGIIGFTKSLAKELGSRNIRVNAVAPGLITTDMTSGLSDEYKQELIGRTCLKRVGTPDDVANTILFLASEMGSFYTAQVLGVHGGIS